LDTNLWEIQSPVGLSELVLAENEEYESVWSFSFIILNQNKMLDKVQFCFKSVTKRENELVRQRLDHGKAWEGALLCKKRTGEQVNMETRAIPVSLSLSSKRFVKLNIDNNQVAVRRDIQEKKCTNS